MYRHAPDKLEGVSAGGITSPGKNSPSRVSLSLSLFLLPSVGNVGVEEREFRNMTSERGEGRVRGRCTPI